MGRALTRLLLIGSNSALFGALKKGVADGDFVCDWLETEESGERAPALRALAQYLYDAYLIDIDGPAADVLANLGPHQLHRPIIALAKRVDEATRATAIAHGAIDCLSYDKLGTIDFSIALSHAATRKRFDDLNASRTDYERLITIISSNFTNLAPDEIDRGIEEVLAVLGRFALVERVFVFLTGEDDKTSPFLSHEWRQESAVVGALPSPAQEIVDHDWVWRTMAAGNTIKLSDPIEAPPEAAGFGQRLHTLGIKSVILTPMFQGRRLVGLLGLTAFRVPRPWTTDVTSLVKIVAETFVNALRRRRDQQALIESEHRFRSLLEGLNEGIVYCDRDDIVLHVSPKACEILGFSASEMVGEHIEKLIVPEESKALLHERTARRLVGISESYEIKLRRKDGSDLWVEMNASPMRDAEGKIIGTLGSFIDITEKKGVGEALRLSEERLRHYFDNSVIGIAISTATKNFIEVNDYMCRLHGYSREELSRMTWVELTHPDDRANDVGWFERLARGEIDNYELDKRFIHKDGYIWNARLVVGAVRHKDRSLDYVIALAQDITAERRAQSALRTQAEFYRQLIDSNPNLIFACDFGGRFTIANKAFAEISGLPVESIIGKRNHEIVSDDASAHRYDEENETVIRSGEPLLVSQDKIIDARDGRERWFQAIKTPLISPDGLTPYILCVASEITDRKRAEDEATLLQRQLLQSHKLEAVGKLAAGIAHDLNNALAAVVGHLHLLGSAVEQRGRGSLETALTGCERASSLIQQLLGFSRQGKYNPQVLSVRDVVEATVAFLAKVIDKDIVVRIGADRNGLAIQGDVAQLQQVFTNLIINSVQAIKGPGSVTIDFGRREVLHPERFNQNAHTGFFVAVSVTDTGAGIAPENLDKIFDPFFTTKSEREGTGLGLSTVYGIMQNHSGWVEVESKVGVGTTFTLLFPQVEATAMQPEPATPPGHADARASGHVLIIDDEAVLVDLARQFFMNAGVQVTGFSDPREALEWYGSHAFDVDIVILDMTMPRIDGTTCFHEIRKINADACVVIMSGYVEDTAAQALLEEGVYHFFEKPLRYPELVSWVLSQLQERHRIAV